MNTQDLTGKFTGKNQDVPYEIRKLTTPESLQVVRDISNDIWPKTYRGIVPDEQIPYMMEMMYSPAVMEKELAEGYSFAALDVDGQSVGYISWSAYPNPGSTEAKLHKLYLLGEYHGKGWGQIMLKYVKDEARKAGFLTLRLNVNKYNAAAQKAYKRAGFAIVEAPVVDIGGGFVMDDYVMKVTLS